MFFFIPGFLCDIGVEAREEFPVELLEHQVFPVVLVPDVVCQMLADAPIFIICGLAAADADHTVEFFVVLPEKGEHGLLPEIGAEIHLFDHHRSYELLLVE